VSERLKNAYLPTPTREFLRQEHPLDRQQIDAQFENNENNGVKVSKCYQGLKGSRNLMFTSKNFVLGFAI